jgi:sortase A
MTHRVAGGRAGTVSLWAEVVSWTFGVTALTVWALMIGSGRIAAHQALQQFASLAADGLVVAGPPDQRLWSPERVRAWLDTHNRAAPAPLAVLRIPRIPLEVAVLEGADEWTLNRAVGHIEDTALPGAEGNVGIAGHRDGFFRGLKDTQPGDVLEIETITGIDFYRVERIWIVEPDEVSVLDPTPARSVTLVTCYPFYFIGSAPQRFIVRAVWTHAAPRHSTVN